MNTEIIDTELLIIGGGCAGLSLASALIKRSYSKRVVILESRNHYVDDRSWCVWSDIESRAVENVSTSWSSWAFNIANSPVQKRSGEALSYKYIRSLDFYQRRFAEIKRTVNVSLHLNEAVEQISFEHSKWVIKTSSSFISSTYLIDTRPPVSDILKKSILFQCFLGYEIELEKPLTTDVLETAELMTNMRLVEGEFCFNYILPISSTRLLVEVTFFARNPVPEEVIQTELSALLLQRGWATATIIRSEASTLPMGLPEPKTKYPLTRISAGIGGGALRPSSSYGFLRINRWADACAKELCLGKPPQSHQDKRSLSDHVLRFMDLLFLNVIHRYPHLTPTVFARLFGSVKTPSFIRFMVDRPQIIDVVRVVMALPKIPFLNVLIRPRIKK